MKAGQFATEIIILVSVEKTPYHYLRGKKTYELVGAGVSAELLCSCCCCLAFWPGSLFLSWKITTRRPAIIFTSYVGKGEVGGGLGLHERGGRCSITYIAMKPPEVERKIRTSSLDMPVKIIYF